MNKRGQSILEYAFGISAVAAVCISVVVSLGTSIQGQMAQTLAISDSNPISSPSVTTDVSSVSATGTSVSLPTIQPGAGTKTLKIKLADGREVVIPGYPVDLAEAIETSGSGGVTQSLASILDTLANEIAVKNPEQAKALKELATVGYYTAQYEASLENMLKACHGNTDCYGKEVVAQKLGSYDPNRSETSPFPDIMVNGLWTGAGHPDSPLSAHINTYQNESHLSANYSRFLSRSPSNTGAYGEQMFGFYYKALKTGALDDPAVKSLVQNVMAQMHRTAKIACQEIDPQKMATYVKDTDQNSSTICKTGHGKREDVSGTIECL